MLMRTPATKLQSVEKVALYGSPAASRLWRLPSDFKGGSWFEHLAARKEARAYDLLSVWTLNIRQAGTLGSFKSYFIFSTCGGGGGFTPSICSLPRVLVAFSLSKLFTYLSSIRFQYFQLLNVSFQDWNELEGPRVRQNHFRHILTQLRFDEQQAKEQQIRRMGQECRVWTKSSITDGGSKATKGVWMDWIPF